MKITPEQLVEWFFERINEPFNREEVLQSASKFLSEREEEKCSCLGRIKPPAFHSRNYCVSQPAPPKEELKRIEKLKAIDSGNGFFTMTEEQDKINEIIEVLNNLRDR